MASKPKKTVGQRIEDAIKRQQTSNAAKNALVTTVAAAAAAPVAFYTGETVRKAIQNNPEAIQKATTALQETGYFLKDGVNAIIDITGSTIYNARMVGRSLIERSELLTSLWPNIKPVIQLPMQGIVYGINGIVHALAAAGVPYDQIPGIMNSLLLNALETVTLSGSTEYSGVKGGKIPSWQPGQQPEPFTRLDVPPPQWHGTSIVNNSGSLPLSGSSTSNPYQQLWQVTVVNNSGSLPPLSGSSTSNPYWGGRTRKNKNRKHSKK